MSEIKYKLNRDIIIDKYHSGYHTFKKGSVVKRLGRSFNNIYLSSSCAVVELIGVERMSEAPRVFIVNLSDLDFIK